MARTYGRLKNPDGTRTWVTVQTDANGSNSYVQLTTLCQVLQLVLNESPFYAQYGIPATESVITQIYPTYYVQIVQQQFAQYFASLSIVLSTSGQKNSDGSIDPVYNVTAVLLDGTIVQRTVAT